MARFKAMRDRVVTERCCGLTKWKLLVRFGRCCSAMEWIFVGFHRRFVMSRLWVSRWRYSPEQPPGENDVGTAKAFQLGSLSMCTLLLLLYGCGLAQSFLWPIDGMRTDRTDSGALRKLFWTHSRSAGKWMTLAATLSSFVYPLSVSYNLCCFHQVCSAPAEWPCGTESNITRTRRWSVSENFTAQR